MLKTSGIQNAPNPKKTPRRFKLAIFLSSLLKSDISALVAPLMTPPPIPKNKIHTRNNHNDQEWPIPMNPIAKNNEAVAKTHL